MAFQSVNVCRVFCLDKKKKKLFHNMWNKLISRRLDSMPQKQKTKKEEREREREKMANCTQSCEIQTACSNLNH